MRLCWLAVTLLFLTGCGTVPGDVDQPGEDAGAAVPVDTDSDGVTDLNDDCPGTPSGAAVDDNGCALSQVDSDGDGFSDDMEINSTPGTDPFDPTDNPNNVRDTDGDGCSDYDELNFLNFCDNDPNTPGNTGDPITPEVRAACSTLSGDDAGIVAIIGLYEEGRAEGWTVDDQVASAQVACSQLCNGDAICQDNCFACHAAMIDFVYAVSDAGSRLCPIELDGPGFSVTIPCGFTRRRNDPVEGRLYDRVYANTDLLIGVVVLPTQSQGSLPEEFITFQLNGRVTTSTGDFLLNVNAEASGLEGEGAIGMLANGDFLKVLVVGTSFDQDIQLVAAGVFLSIDLQDTDGSGYIDFLAADANVLQVRPSDGYIVLEDDSVWFVGTDDDAVVAFWNDADLVLRRTPDSPLDDAMFTSMVSWESVDARLCGTGTQAVVAGINEPDFGAREIALVSGAILESSFADEDKLLFWQVGDPVSVVTGASCSTWSTYVVNLRTGSTVGIP